MPALVNFRCELRHERPWVANLPFEKNVHQKAFMGLIAGLPDGIF
jgi:hypothetical protein